MDTFESRIMYITEAERCPSGGELLRFLKTREFWSSKANWRVRFSLPSITLTDLLRNRWLWFVIGGFPSVLCVSVFQGSLLVIVIVIDGSENAILKAAFELQSARVLKKRSNEKE